MYLHPEQLEVFPTAFKQGLPVVTWRYRLTPYGAERLAALNRYDKEDRVAAAVHAAFMIGAGLCLVLVLLAFATNRVTDLWDHIHWPLGLWLAFIATAYLHAFLTRQARQHYPLLYSLALSPGLQHHAARHVSLVFTLHCNVQTPPRAHAQPLMLSTHNRLVSFETRTPQPNDPDQRHTLLAHFASDAATPAQSCLIATWTEGQLEATASHTPLQQLHAQLTWAFQTTRDDWLKEYSRKTRAHT